MQSCVIGGYNVSPGTRLFVNVWAIGRDPNIWSNPEELLPFEDSHTDFRGSNFELLPFGSGRRACPGGALGVANVELALANLLYSFDWHLPEGIKEEDMDMEETGQPVYRKKVSLCLVPIKRSYKG
jgi:4-hydroxyphenylacetaldehyde oxime monooxygenase